MTWPVLVGVLAVGLALSRRRSSSDVTVSMEVGEVTRVPAGMVELKSAPGFYLAPSAAASFDATAPHGLLRVTSAWRSYEQQAELYRQYVAGGNLAAKPGTSKHETGLAVDARGSAAWEAEMARRGWRRTVASEPWHWEFGA